MYPRDRFGGDFDPITGPYFKALQMKAMVEDIAFKREAREQQRREWQVQNEERQRARQLEDFKTNLLLRDMGAMPAEPGASAAGDAAVRNAFDRRPEAYRQLINTPMGLVRLPNQADRGARAEQDARLAGHVEGVKERAKEEVTNPYVDVDFGADFGGKVSVPKKNLADTWIKIYEKKNPNWNISARDNDAGDTTIIATNPRTLEVKELRTIKGAGKSKGASGQSVENFDAEIKSRMDKWRGGHYAQMSITQDIIDAAKGDPRRFTPEESKAAADRIRQAENELYNRALDSVRNSAKGQGSQTAQTAPAAAMPNGVKASQLNDLLAKMRIINPGLTMNDLRKWLSDKRITIEENR